MAISEHDRQVLREFEKDLLTDDRVSSSSQIGRRTGRFLIATAGLVAGLLVMFAGLRLAGPIGTAVGVVGSFILVGSAGLTVHYLSPWLRSQMRSGRDDPKPRP